MVDLPNADFGDAIGKPISPRNKHSLSSRPWKQIS